MGKLLSFIKSAAPAQRAPTRNQGQAVARRVRRGALAGTGSTAGPLALARRHNKTP
jgi:hypothetical protein